MCSPLALGRMARFVGMVLCCPGGWAVEAPGVLLAGWLWLLSGADAPRLREVQALANARPPQEGVARGPEGPSCGRPPHGVADHPAVRARHQVQGARGPLAKGAKGSLCDLRPRVLLNSG